MEYYSIKNRIGSGTFSNVYKCINKITNKSYAMKVLNLDVNAPDNEKKIN